MAKKQVIEKVSIAPVLKGLQKYETASFPLRKYTSVASTIQRIQLETGKYFVQKTNKAENVMEVTRTN